MSATSDDRRPTAGDLSGPLAAFWQAIANMDRRFAEHDGIRSPRPKLTLVKGGRDG